MGNSTTAARLLIVDDERAQMQALCDTLGEHGYEPRGFTSPADALRALAEQPFDLLLTDLMMAEMDGITLLGAAIECQPDLVAVLMTGEGTISTAVQAMQSGALDYIVKPFKLSALLPVIERALAVRQLRLEKAALERNILARTQELRQANKELEAFAHSVAHDLRNPLNAIIGISGLLIEPSALMSESQARSFAANIHTSGLHMGALIDDLLRLSQVSRCEMQRSEADLSAMAREILGKLAADAPARRVAVQVEPGILAHGDPGLLQIALQNLLGNAWKYTAKCADPRIEFGRDAGQPGHYLVRDNGAGFDMARAAHLFEPFHRLHSDADFAGTGIGLSIVQRIVERHGGRIGVEAGLGLGACFRFTLGPA